MLLLRRAIQLFSRKTRPLPKVNPFKEVKVGTAQTDEKAAKLSKSELESQIKQRLEQQKNKKSKLKDTIQRHKQHHSSLELSIDEKTQYQIESNKAFKYGIAFNRKFEEKPVAQLSDSLPLWDEKGVPGNYTRMLNKRFEGQIKPIDKPAPLSRRCGALGYKLGMTSLWDKWGNFHAVTVVQLDRCQVIRIKTKQQDGYNAVQVGAGEAKMHLITKPMLGHFLKWQVPPKKDVAQFHIEPQNHLPLGYSIGARHFTPGQVVDCISKSIGKGFQGTIKRFGFKIQPRSHGNSKSHRVLGSTGMRQTPGRVFKNKKMYGRMGGEQRITYSLKVFKIDVERNLLYIKGCLSGKPGTCVRIRDGSKKKAWEHNQQFVSYPTFLEQPGQQYANEMEMFTGIEDTELELHDNAYIVDDGLDVEVQEEEEKKQEEGPE